MTYYDEIDADDLADDEPDERDHWQEYKDDLAMGRIYEDGTQREPDPPEEYGPEEPIRLVDDPGPIGPDPWAWEPAERSGPADEPPF